MHPLPEGPSVLAVDDDPVNLLVIEASLEPVGYDVRTALDLGEARTLMDGWRPDVLLLDVMMPGESGIDACRTWRADRDWDGLPIVLLTALRAEEHRVSGLMAGADDFLEKPIDIDALQRTVRRWAATGRQAGTIPTAGEGIIELAVAMARAITTRPRRDTSWG